MRGTTQRSLTVSVAAVFVVALTGVASAAPGDLDPSFSGDGIARTDFTRSGDNGYALALQPDGKLIVAGEAHVGLNPTFALARYNTDGSLDTGFGGDGKVMTDLSRFEDLADGVAVQADGKIVVSGDYAWGSGDSGWAIVRYNADGTLDDTFGGGDGKVKTQLSAHDDSQTGLALAPDGSIVLSGGAASDRSGASRLAVARYDANGSLDTTFSRDGIAMIDLTGWVDVANAVVVQNDGNLVAAGVIGPRRGRFAIVRFRTNGTLDDTFDGDGLMTVTFSAGGANAQALVMQPDEKIVAAGGAESAAGDWRFAIARVDTDGSLDTTFGGGDGKETINFTSASDYASGVALAPGGKIAVAGTASWDVRPRFAVARLDALGALDATFGNKGTVMTNLGLEDSSRGVVVQPDANVVVSGYDTGKFAIVRYLGA